MGREFLGDAFAYQRSRRGLLGEGGCREHGKQERKLAHENLLYPNGKRPQGAGVHLNFCR